MTLSPELETRIQQQAVRAGLSAEAWLQQQVLRYELDEDVPWATSLQDELTPDEWIRQFRAWAESHDRTTPPLSNDVISRDSIYSDRF